MNRQKLLNKKAHQRQKARKAAVKLAKELSTTQPTNRAQQGRPRKGSRRWHFGLNELGIAGVADIKGLSMGSGSGKPRRGTDMVGLAEPSKQLQVILPTSYSGYREDGVYFQRVAGTDHVAKLNIPAGTRQGTVLLRQDINPTAFPRSRLLQLSALYQRFVFPKARFTFSPAASAMRDGAIVGYCDFDVMTRLPDYAADNYDRAVAHQGQREAKMWQTQTWEMGQSPTFTDLFVSDQGADPRLSIQGTFYLLAAVDFTEDVNAGNIWLEYNVEFSIPQLGHLPGGLGLSYGTVTGATGNDLFGTAIVVDQHVGVTVEEVDGNSIVVRNVPGAYRLTLTYCAQFTYALAGSDSGDITFATTNLTESTQFGHIVGRDTYYDVMVYYVGTADETGDCTINITESNFVNDSAVFVGGDWQVTINDPVPTYQDKLRERERRRSEKAKRDKAFEAFMQHLSMPPFNVRPPRPASPHPNEATRVVADGGAGRVRAQEAEAPVSAKWHAAPALASSPPPTIVPPRVPRYVDGEITPYDAAVKYKENYSRYDYLAGVLTSGPGIEAIAWRTGNNDLREQLLTELLCGSSPLDRDPEDHGGCAPIQPHTEASRAFCDRVRKFLKEWRGALSNHQVLYAHEFLRQEQDSDG